MKRSICWCTLLGGLLIAESALAAVWLTIDSLF
jgi:hypothetical protein